jgi:hypothetical protein
MLMLYWVLTPLAVDVNISEKHTVSIISTEMVYFVFVVVRVLFKMKHSLLRYHPESGLRTEMCYGGTGLIRCV